jgi:hypothetical protein
MKNHVTIFFLLAIVISGCKKSQPSLTALASINVTNVVIGGAALTLNSSAQTVGSNSCAQFPLLAGTSLVNLYPPASPGTSYYDQNIQTTEGSYYSLFLSGTSPSAIDNVLIRESYKNYTDSICGFRFINLAPGSNPISINLTGAAAGSTVSSLPYKSYSNFIQLPGKAANTGYSFEFRDATSRTLIATYTFSAPSNPPPYFHNVTLVLKGLVGGSPAANVLLDKDY